MNPTIIQIDPVDNVAIVANDEGLPSGTLIAGGITLREFVPQGHKVALSFIQKDSPIIRFGEVIGWALEDRLEGSWLNERNIRMPESPGLYDLSWGGRERETLLPLERLTFEGYRNADGSVGTKNVLGIVTSVQCVTGVADHVVAKAKRELLPKYPNVDDIVAITHAFGCGVAIQAPDAAIPTRTLMNLAKNPNLGGEVLVLGLGCEKLQPAKLVPEGHDQKDDMVCLQEVQEEGFGGMVNRLMTMVETRLAKLDQRRRETCPVSDLVVGLQCGGSDAFSGVTANPAVGYAADCIVRAGGTVLFSEVTEVRDAIGANVE